MFVAVCSHQKGGNKLVPVSFLLLLVNEWKQMNSLVEN